MSDHPIEPQDYVYGVKVVDIGDARVERGMTRRNASSCKHIRVVYDSSERRVFCKDCEKGVDPFDAFLMIVERFAAADANIKRATDQANKALQSSIISRAAQSMDKAWRRKNTTPACPHCREALLPEDFAAGVKTSVSKELARRKRAKRQSNEKT